MSWSSASLHVVNSANSRNKSKNCVLSAPRNLLPNPHGSHLGFPPTPPTPSARSAPTRGSATRRDAHAHEVCLRHTLVQAMYVAPEVSTKLLPWAAESKLLSAVCVPAPWSPWGVHSPLLTGGVLELLEKRVEVGG